MTTDTYRPTQGGTAALAPPRSASSATGYSSRLAEFPEHGIPREEPAPGLAQRTPPIGGWAFHNLHSSRQGWHIACPCCLAGRALLLPDPNDPYEYELQPHSCSRGCDPRAVVRWYAVREGNMDLWFNWLA